MNNLVKVIGEIVLTILIIAIPMLTVFSFCLDWWPDIKWILTLLTAVDAIAVGSMVDTIIEKSTH